MTGTVFVVGWIVGALVTSVVLAVGLTLWIGRPDDADETWALVVAAIAWPAALTVVVVGGLLWLWVRGLNWLTRNV